MKKGSSTASSHSFADERIFSSFSHRNSFTEMKEPTSIVTSSAATADQLSASVSLRNRMPCMPDTRYVAGMNCVTAASQPGNIEAGNVAPLRNSMGM